MNEVAITAATRSRTAITALALRDWANQIRLPDHIHVLDYDLPLSTAARVLSLVSLTTAVVAPGLVTGPVLGALGFGGLGPVGVSLVF
ncbi:hypothetical protein CAC42_5881 [Sphaceloma murrayae]|uniref:Uncharacterized protein n=1 Tax=Sphaceloma murrayae TaxID=2082308 RepID=A0A2K1QZG3_9PEZI|nr:hypothetical protein CAC42_5881 [Sphaceloma murrayae]